MIEKLTGRGVPDLLEILVRERRQAISEGNTLQRHERPMLAAAQREIDAAS
ncbi:hypothetical protein KO481_11075 [Nocardia sp. NEAU-G5]|uniref:Uncharacterized protein n=1 Tax=Nocardia albiluteola TaxID=2842303 RepID=A0ABS6AVK3_9NOCA|nr:hypothetical protein [Nocardia albiluteola]MBU3062064.1 hypothetical protein [Nocardia albiluteola]